MREPDDSPRPFLTATSLSYLASRAPLAGGGFLASAHDTYGDDSASVCSRNSRHLPVNTASRVCCPLFSGRPSTSRASSVGGGGEAGLRKRLGKRRQGKRVPPPTDAAVLESARRPASTSPGYMCGRLPYLLRPSNKPQTSSVGRDRAPLAWKGYSREIPPPLRLLHGQPESNG